MGDPSSIDATIMHALLLGVVMISAATDVRWGKIPNWLTLPVIVGAPIVLGVVDGMGGLLRSVLGILVCSVVPLLIWYRGGMAAGDVKLFAAIGAVAGIYVGLEAQFLSLVAAAIYSVGKLAWSGRLLSGLINSVFVGLNPVLPKRMRRPIPQELMNRIRLGAAVLLGTVIALAGHHREYWS